VPVLPLIDLLILLGTGSLMLGFVLKAAAIATRYSPTFLGFSPNDYVVIAGVCFGFALTLAARTWVKLNEPRLLARRWRASEAELRWEAEELEQEEGVEARRAQRNERKAAGAS
jgi:UDP-N-acetylmuramyl pentapeptide phosphotransferase/UDP-N-acetylglucosamine-1-phosphate transferase